MEKKFAKTRMTNNNRLGEGIFVLEFENKLGVIPKPGQFIMLEPLYMRSLSPRPFSIIYADYSSILVMVKVAGKNTEIYSDLEEGNKINIAGPLGRPFIFEKGKKYIFVAGGIGLAGILWPLIELSSNKKKQI